MATLTEHEMSIIEVIAGTIIQIAKSTFDAIDASLAPNSLEYDFTRDAAVFELEVFNLFKVDYAAFNQSVPNSDRDKLIYTIQDLLLARYTRDKLSSEPDTLLTVIEQRLENYSKRISGKREFSDLYMALVKELQNNLLNTQVPCNSVKKLNPLFIDDAFQNIKFFELLLQCDTREQGMGFWGFMNTLFEKHANVFSMTSASIRAEANEYFE